MARPSRHPRTSAASQPKATTSGKAVPELLADPVGPYWLQLRWTLSGETLGRAAAALGPAWHGAAPVIRIEQLGGSRTQATTTLLSEDPLPKDTRSWFARVPTPAGRYRAQIGFARGADFHLAAVSQPVTTPSAATPAADSGVPLAPQILSELRNLADDPDRRPSLEVTPELTLAIRTDPGRQILVDEHPQTASTDGSITTRHPLEPGRQVISIDAPTDPGQPSRRVLVAFELSVRSLDED